MIGTYLKLGSAVLALIAVLWVGLAIYHAGIKTGSDKVQLAWDKDKAQIQATTDAAIAQATKDKLEAIAANEVIANDYQNQLSAARALSDSLAQRLRIATSKVAAGGGTVSQGPNNTIATGTGSTSTVGQLNEILAATLTECRNNSAQLNSLIAEVKRQL